MSNIISYEEFEDMVRSRPLPDTPGYYSLKVFTYTKENYSREEVNGHITYRCPLSVRQAEFPTKEEAVAAMENIITSSDEKICVFSLDRLPFGRFDKHPFWVEAWTFDAKGEVIMEAAYSATHYHESGIAGKFFGYLPEKIRWHNGQIVGILHRYFRDYRDYATLAVVVEQPKDTVEGYDGYLNAISKWVREGNSPDSWLEMTAYSGSDDDEMFTQYGPYNGDLSNFTFNHPLIVFPAPDNLPEDIKAELASWYNDYIQFEESEKQE